MNDGLRMKTILWPPGLDHNEFDKHGVNWPGTITGALALFPASDSMPIRLTARLIPLLIFIVVAFALLQLYTAVMYAGQQQLGFAAFYTVFGFAGVALARALWINRGKFGSPEDK